MNEPEDEHRQPAPDPLPPAPAADAVSAGPTVGQTGAISPTLPLAGSPEVPVRPVSHLGFWLALLVLGTGYVGLWFAGGEAQKVAVAGLEPLPFLGLALLATVGLRHVWARAVTLVYWLLLVAGMGLVAWALTVAAVVDPDRLVELLKATESGAEPEVTPAQLFPPGSLRPVLLGFLGIAAGGLFGLLGFLPAVRRSFARVLPLGPQSFVHATALATLLGLTAICFVPLLALEQPPLLLILQHFAGKEFGGKELAEEQLHEQFYGLAWTIPVAVVAVGYPLRRTLGQALQRVGLVWPKAWQIPFAVITAAVLVVVMVEVEDGIAWLWRLLGWPETDTRAFSELMKFAISPVGAVVIGVTAGLGEELSVRGVLQPRLGILLSNLFFVGLHALQYNGDALLSVFLVGLILGVIRKRTNTTTSALVHGTYDFLLILLTYLEVPWFS